MKILGLIPARGGSKGIPRKNLAMLCGKPLIQWTIEGAIKANCLESLCISSDDPEICSFANRYVSYETSVFSIERPSRLATDDASVMDSVWHALDCVIRPTIDAVFLLQPTNPLRTAEDIRQACKMLEAGAQSVVSYSPVGEFHPARMRLEGYPESLFAGYSQKRGFGISWDLSRVKQRQDSPPVCIRDGSVYLATTKWLRKHKGFEGPDSKWIIIPRDRSVRIDEPFDLEYAEFLLTRQRKLASNTA